MLKLSVLQFYKPGTRQTFLLVGLNMLECVKQLILKSELRIGPVFNTKMTYFTETSQTGRENESFTLKSPQGRYKYFKMN